MTDGRERKRLGNVVGLDQFGVNLTRLKPGAESSQRHWHENEDEFVYMLEGEVVLSEDDGETVAASRATAAGWKAGVPTAIGWSTGRSATPSISKSARARRRARAYPDIDLVVERDEHGMRFCAESGEPYPKET